MSKLILCLDQETFTLDIKGIDKNEEGGWRYWSYGLYMKSPETTRLVRCLGYCRFEPIWYSGIEIKKTEEDVKGLFGGKRTVTKYWFKTSILEDRLHPKVMYLEE